MIVLEASITKGSACSAGFFRSIKNTSSAVCVQRNCFVKCVAVSQIAKKQNRNIYKYVPSLCFNLDYALSTAPERKHLVQTCILLAAPFTLHFTLFIFECQIALDLL